MRRFFYLIFLSFLYSYSLNAQNCEAFDVEQTGCKTYQFFQALNAETYNWNFGDGSSSSLRDPSHTFQYSGTYDVCLTMPDSECREPICRKIEVEPCQTNCDDLRARFQLGNVEDKTASFEDQSQGENIIGWRWNFGDETQSNQQHPTHTFPAYGEYQVCLEVRKSLGNGEFCTSEPFCRAYTFSNCTVVADFTFEKNSTGFDFTATSTGNGSMTHQWDFGDGNNGTGATISHNYSPTGTYTACLTTTNTLSNGAVCVDKICYEVGTPKIIGDDEVCAEDKTIYEVPMVVGNSYLWNVSGGNPFTQLSPNKIEVCWLDNSDLDRLETVGLQIVSPNGNICPTDLDVTVHPLPDAVIQYPEICGIIWDDIPYQELERLCPDAEFLPQRKDACVMTCENLKTVYRTPSTAGSTYEWLVEGGIIQGSNTDDEVCVQWGDSQPANLTLVEINTYGCTDTMEICIEFTPSPYAEISANTVCLGQATSFCIDTICADDWTWIFPDGSTSDQLKPDYTFATGGNHQVCLVIEKTKNYAVPGFQHDDPTSGGDGQEIFDCVACRCTDTLKLDVYVEPVQGPDIECISMVCPGDTVCYETSAMCGTFTWLVTGNNTILSGGGATDNEICIIWGDGPAGTISLEVSGCSVPYCMIPTVETVPILGDEFEIDGPTVVCRTDEHFYSTTKFPGAFYTWEAIGGTITGDPHSNYVSVVWDNVFPIPGVGQLIVTADSYFLNPDGTDGGCWGTDTLDVLVLPDFQIYGQSQVCAGSTTTYYITNSAAGGVDWSVIGGTITSSPTNSTSVTIDWDQGPGTFIINAVPHDPNVFCNDEASFVVEVVQVPKPDSISGPDFICPGDTYTYNVHGVEAGNQVVWNVVGGTPATSMASSISVTWNASGPYQISVAQRLLNPYCLSDTVQLNVLPVLASSISLGGPNDVCTNEMVSYSATPVVPGEDYMWSISPASAGTITNGQGSPNIDITWGAVGATPAILTLTICGQTANYAVNVHDFNPTLVITGNSFCPDGTSTLSTNYGGIGTYTWEFEDGSSAGTTPSITVNDAGCYSVTVTDNNGCSESAQYCIEEFPLATYNISSPDPTVICTNGTIHDVDIYAPVASEIANYEWFCNGVSVLSGPISNVYTHTGTSANGTFSYCVVITTDDGCTFKSNVLVVVHKECVADDQCDPDPSSVDFSWTALTYCNQLTFTPSPLLSGTHKWYFGDGNTSNNTTPTHTYALPGFKTVILHVTVPNASPPPDSCLIKAIHTDVEVPAAADFEAPEVCAGTPTTFTSTSQTITGTITNYEWDIDNDGTFDYVGSGLNVLNHTYATGGTKTVTLVITASSGCRAIMTKTIEVTPSPTAIFTSATTACVGDGIDFIDGSISNTTTGIITWDWDFDEAGGISNDQNPHYVFQSAGTKNVTLTVTNIFGCESTVTVPITVVAPQITSCPITPAGPIDVCVIDLPYTLTAPTSGNGVYLWSNGATTPTLDVYSSGEYTVTIYDVNGCPCVSDPVVVNVTPVPNVVIRGETELCVGETTNLDATMAGNNFTYSWNTGSTNSILYSVGAGTYTVTVTNTLTNCENTATVTVNVHPLPATPTITASQPLPLCEGVPINLSVTPVAGLTYKWNTGDIGPNITVSTAGVYIVTACDIYGCTSMETITVNPLPDVCLVPSGCYERCIGDTLCIPDYFASYQWYLDGNPITGLNDTCVILNVEGIYQVELTNIFGCSQFSEPLDISLVPCDEDPCDDVKVTYTETETPQDYCCYDFEITNNLVDQITSVEFKPLYGGAFDMTNRVNLDGTQWSLLQNTASNIEIISNTGTLNGDCQLRYLPTGTYDAVKFCLENYSTQPQELEILWKNCDDIVCRDTLYFDCSRCVDVYNDSLWCENGQFKYEFDITNVWDQQICNLTVDVFDPSGVSVVPNPINFSPCLNPGDIALDNLVCMDNLESGDTVKLVMRATTFLQDDEDLAKSGFNGCISDTICLVMPECPCDPCDSIEYVLTPITVDNEDDCCYSMDFKICADDFTGVQVNALNGVYMSSQIAGSGWFMSYNTTTSASYFPLPPGPHSTTIPPGTHIGKVQFCLNGYDNPVQIPQLVEVNWLTGSQQSIACSDTLETFCEPPVQDDCAMLSDSSWVCNEDGSYDLNFKVTNLSSFTTEQVKIVNIHTKPTGGIATPDPLCQNVNLAPGGMTNLTMNFDNVAPGDSVCFVIALVDTLIQNNWLEYCCHTDTLCYVVPPCPGCELDVALGNHTALCVGDTYTFNPVITGASGSTTCTWTSSPSIPLTGCNPSFTPTSPGVYSFTVLVNDADGCEARATITIKVEDCCCPAPDEFFEWINQGFDWSTECNRLKVKPVHDFDEDCDVITWSWGDGTPITTSQGNDPVIHTYPNGNNGYVVCMTVTRYDENGEICAQERICRDVFTEECPCKCDKAFYQSVGQGFNTYASFCRKRTFKAKALDEECDEIFWRVTDNTGVVIASGSGLSWMYNFPANGLYEVCMYVLRTTPSGQQCKAKYCQRIKIRCVGPVVVDDGGGVIKNGGFGLGAVAGTIGQGGRVDEWQATSGSPMLMKEAGCDDDNYVELAGNQQVSDILTTNAAIDGGQHYNLTFCYRTNPNFGDLRPGTQIVVRASTSPQQNNDCGSGCQELGRYDLEFSESWSSIYEALTYIPSLNGELFISLHVENDATGDDISSKSVVEIDNVHLEPIDEDCDAIAIDRTEEEGYALTGLPVYRAKESIQTNEQIRGGAHAEFKAGNSITLSAGFSTEDGSTLLVEAESCEETDGNIIENDDNHSSFNTDVASQKLEELHLTAYPNPFNTTTTIVYHLPEGETASLKVYNLNGEIVADLLNGESNISGTTRLELQPQHWSDGIYFIRLHTSDKVITEKLILLK